MKISIEPSKYSTQLAVCGILPQDELHEQIDPDQQ